MLKDQKRDGKVTEHGLYEMLHEYMTENEMLRFVVIITARTIYSCRHNEIVCARVRLSLRVSVRDELSSRN